MKKEVQADKVRIKKYRGSSRHFGGYKKVSISIFRHLKDFSVDVQRIFGGAFGFILHFYRKKNKVR